MASTTIQFRDLNEELDKVDKKIQGLASNVGNLSSAFENLSKKGLADGFINNVNNAFSMLDALTEKEKKKIDSFAESFTRVAEFVGGNKFKLSFSTDPNQSYQFDALNIAILRAGERYETLISKMDKYKAKLVEVLSKQNLQSESIDDNAAISSIKGHIEKINEQMSRLKPLYDEYLKVVSLAGEYSVKSDKEEIALKTKLESLYKELISTQDKYSKALSNMSSKKVASEDDKELVDSYKKKIDELSTSIAKVSKENLSVANSVRDAFKTQILEQQIKSAERYDSVLNKLVADEEKENNAVRGQLIGLYRELSSNMDKASDAQLKMQLAMKQGQTDISLEENLLRQYNSNIKNIQSSINELAKKYPELYNEIKKSFDPSLNENAIKNEIKRRDAIDKTTESLERQRIADEKREEQDAKTQAEALKRAKAAWSESRNKTPQGALAYSSTATTLEQDRQAIKYLTEAREKLDRNDKNYKQTLEQLNAAIDEHKENIDEVTGKTRRFNNENSKLIPKLKELAGAIGIAYGFQGIANFVTKVVQVTGEFELQTVAIGSIVGSLSKASDIFGEIQSMALKSPFTVKQLTEQTKKLSAYRIETEKLLPTLKQLGDISSGLGVDINRLILAYGQVKAANYLRGQELRQFSEAGINILGELAKYFSEIEGRVVRVGDVFGMVSARMVTFEDVAEVFDRLTKKGGVFYKMQEKQAETISGKISNLKDAWLLLLNSIGSSQSGFIKGFLSGLQWLILNIGKLTDIIFQLGTAVAVFEVAKFIKANDVLNILKTRIVGITGALKSMWAVIAANPILAVIAALAALAVKVGVASIQYKKACKEISEAQIELSAKIKRETESVEEMWKNMATPDLRGMRESIETLFQKFRDEGLIVKNPLASKEFESETEEGLRKMLETIKKDAEKANAIMAEAGKVSARSFWNSFFTDDFFLSFGKRFSEVEGGKKVFTFKGEQFGTDIEDYDSRLKNMISNAYKLSDVINELDEKGFSSNTLEELRKIDETENKTVLDYERQAELIGKLKEELSSSSSIKEKDLIYWKEIKQAVKDYNKYRKASVELEKEMQWAMSKSPYFKNINYNEVYTNEEKRIEYIQEKLQFLKGAAKGIMTITPEMENDYIKKWNDALNKISGTKISVDVLLNPTTENTELTDWQVDYNRFINELEIEFANKFNLTTKKYTETSKELSKLFGASGDELKKYSEYFNVEFLEIIRSGDVSYNEVREKMRKRIKDVQQVRRDIKKISGDVEADSKEGRSIMQYLVDNLGINDPRLVTKQGFLNIALVNSMLDEVDSMNERISNYLLLGDKKEHKGSKKSYKPEFESMIRFIRQLYSETEKLNKTFDNTESIDGWTASLKRVRDSFGGEFEAMPKEFKKLFSDLMTNVDFSDPLAISKQLEKLKQLAKTGKYRPEMSEIIRLIEKNIAEVRIDIDVELKKGYDEKLVKQIEDLFADYEVGVELKKLGISAKDAKTIFNLDAVDLSELESKVYDMREKFIGKDAEKKYADFINKLQDINDKAQLERLKKYSKYLQEEMSERVRIEIETMKMLAEVDAQTAFSPEQKSRIKTNIKEEQQKKLDTQEWKEFQQSDIYVELFGDIERASTEALMSMIGKLEQYKDSLKGLSATELKTVEGQLNQLKEQIRQNNPFLSLKYAIEEYRNAVKSVREDADIKELFPGANLKNINKFMRENIVSLGEQLSEQREITKEAEKQYQLANQRDLALSNLSKYDLFYSEEAGVDPITEYVSQLEYAKKKLSESQEGTDEYNYWQVVANQIQTIVDNLTLLEEALEGLGENGTKSTKELGDAFDDAAKKEKTLSNANSKLIKLDNALTEKQKSLIASFNKASDEVANLKEHYENVVSYLQMFDETTNDTAETWEEFGSTVFDTIIGILSLFPTLIVQSAATGTAVNASLGIIGLIAEAVNLIIQLLKAVAQLNDNLIQVKIDKIKDSVDKLADKYEKLSRAFDDAYDIDRIRTFNAEMQYSTQQQIAGIEQMIKLEQYKKKTDKEQIEQWNKDIEDLNEQLAENAARFYEELGGFGSEANYKSAAEEFVNAWYDAFMETGDGLTGLEDTFDSFVENLIKKNLMQSILSKYVTDMLQGFDKLVGKEGGITQNRDAWNEYLDSVQLTISDANEELKAAMDVIRGVFGVSGGLEGLQEGIQGMSETTAEAITAYLNAIRMYVAEQNVSLQSISESLTSSMDNNGILANIRLIANNTSAIHQLFSSVVQSGGHPLGGAGIRVFMD